MPTKKRISKALYESELTRLQTALVKLQQWVVQEKHKIVVIFERQDAARKGGVIKRIAEKLNPRVCRIASLPAPSDTEKTSWY